MSPDPKDTNRKITNEPEIQKKNSDTGENGDSVKKEKEIIKNTNDEQRDIKGNPDVPVI